MDYDYDYVVLLDDQCLNEVEGQEAALRIIDYSAWRDEGEWSEEIPDF